MHSSYNDKIGKEFAQRVAERLKTKSDLMYDHRDYCGMGLTWVNGKFLYGKIYDGFQVQATHEFDNEQRFVEWLAEQSDASLDGSEEGDFYKNNQRITRARLFEFVSSKPRPRSGP